MKEVLQLSTHGKFNVNWGQKFPKRFKGLILPKGEVYSVDGGFGDFTYQNYDTHLTSIWLGEYDCIRRSRFFSSATVSPIELSCVLIGTFISRLSGEIRYSPKGIVMNLICSPGMQNDVTFEKDMFIRTCDFHIKEPLMKILLNYFGDLLDPFMNAVAQERMAIFFKKEIYADPVMYSLLKDILFHIQQPVPDDGIINMQVVLLFGNFLCASAKRSGSKYKLDVAVALREKLEAVRKALMDRSKDRYTFEQIARETGISATQLKLDFKEHFGMSFTDLRQHIKFETASAMMADGDVTFLQIADELNYSSVRSLQRFLERQSVKENYSWNEVLGLWVPKSHEKTPKKK